MATFVKKGTGQKTELSLKKLGWKNNLKHDILKILANGEFRYLDLNRSFKNAEGEVIKETKSESQASIRNRISELRKDLQSYFINTDPIEHDNGKWETLIDIVLLDREEVAFETEVRFKREFGFEGEEFSTYVPKFRDAPEEDSIKKDKFSAFLSIDDEEEDNSY